MNNKHLELIEAVRQLFVSGEIDAIGCYWRLEHTLSGAEIGDLIAQWEPERTLSQGVDLLERALAYRVSWPDVVDELRAAVDGDHLALLDAARVATLPGPGQWTQTNF